MDSLTRTDLRDLAAAESDACISIYLPTSLNGQENLIRFRNLRRETEHWLSSLGLSDTRIAALLSGPTSLLEDAPFWQTQPAGGVAAFFSDDLVRHFSLPAAFREIVIVSHRFYIKPLFPLLAGNAPFHILALSTAGVRLFHGTRDMITEEPSMRLPGTLVETLNEEVTSGGVQSHTRTAPSSGDRRPAVFHGHAAAGDESKDRLLRYFRRVNEAVRQILRDAEAPLVLAGVDYYRPIYREANTYPYLMDAGISGNVDRVPPEELKRRGWELVKPMLERECDAEEELYRQMKGTGRTSNDLSEILSAAEQGRVSTVFVSDDTEDWGRFDSDTGRVVQHEKPEPGDDGLLDLAVAKTFLAGGKIFVLPQASLPDRSEAAALYRY